MVEKFQNLISTFQDSIFTRDYFCDFEKISKNTFDIKVQLNILNSLLGEKQTDEKFIQLVETYPEVRKVLPLLVATRLQKIKEFSVIKDPLNIEPENKYYLFDPSVTLNNKTKEELLVFWKKSGLKKVLEEQMIGNITDYVFGVETGLDTNARKNRTGKIMEKIVKEHIEKFCKKNCCKSKEQATAKRIENNWNIYVKSDKSDRRFDFAVLNKNNKLYLLEVNYYGGGGSKLKSVAGEFSYLYDFLQKQKVQMFWITDGLGWNTARKPLEEAYNATNGSIYNLEMLKNGILDEIIE